LRPVLIILVGGSLLLSQDHVGQAPAQADVDAGLRLYRANCSNCHGVEGAGVPGVDLGHNKFKRASNDEDLVRIIATGIPGTGMPPANIPREQALNIVAYLRSLAAPTTFQGGDATRGRELFAANGCVNCHRILGVGSRVGPDLSEIGSFRKPTELQQSILDPNAEIKPENRTFTAVTRDGKKITGRVINEDAFTVEVIDSHEQLGLLERADLRESSFSDKSAMPSFASKLNGQEVADLVTYLMSLRRLDSK
jgi:putative heme-binding domain-containing protein